MVQNQVLALLAKNGAPLTIKVNDWMEPTEIHVVCVQALNAVRALSTVQLLITNDLASNAEKYKVMIIAAINSMAIKGETFEFKSTPNIGKFIRLDVIRSVIKE